MKKSLHFLMFALQAILSATVSAGEMTTPDKSKQEAVQQQAPVKSDVHTSAQVLRTYTFADLDAVRSENVILSERSKNKELKSKIDGGGIGLLTPPTPGQQITPPRKSSTKKGGEGSGSLDKGARVYFVGGAGENISALIRFSDGTEIKVKRGQQVSGLGTIKSIRTDEVLAVDGKQTYVVPFAAEGVSAPAPSTPNAGTMVPAITGVN